MHPTSNNIKQIRSLIIAGEETASEYGYFLQHLLTGLQSYSMPVTLICPMRGDFESFVPPFVNHIRYPFVHLPVLSSYNLKLLYSELEKFKPTVIHCLSSKYEHFARKAACHLGVKYVMNVDRLVRYGSYVHFCKGTCGKIIVPSDTIGKATEKKRRCGADKIVEIKPGTFVHDECSSFSNTRQLPTIVTPLYRGKAQSEAFANFLGALRHLLIDGYEFMVLAVADHPVSKEIRALINELGLRSTLTFSSRCHDWHKIFCQADIFVKTSSTSRYEYLVLEAMAAGVACAGCRDNVEDLLIHDETALIFDSEDQLSIYGALMKLLNSHDFARKLARSGQQRVRQEHSASRMVDEVIEVYSLSQ